MIKELEKLGDTYSGLVITPIENLQKNATRIVKNFTKSDIPGIYVCLNRPYKTVKKYLEKKGLKTDKIFFIDCITSSLDKAEESENVLHIQSPSDLTGLNIAISEFSEKIPGKKFLLIDALASLLIYNTENLVVKFVKLILEDVPESGLKAVMLTPATKGGELINKVSLFFDKVIKE